MIRAIYFSLNFVMIFLGVVLAIHFDLWIGLSLIALFTFKFFLQLPSTESNKRLDESFKKAKQMEFKFDK